MKGKFIRHKEAGACYEVVSEPLCEVTVSCGEDEQYNYMLIVKNLETKRFHFINLNDLNKEFEEIH